MLARTVWAVVATASLASAMTPSRSLGLDVRSPARSPHTGRVVRAAAQDLDFEPERSVVNEIVALSAQNYVNKARRLVQAMEKERAVLAGIPKADVTRAYMALWDAAVRTKKWGLVINIYQHLRMEDKSSLSTEMVDTALFACERRADGFTAEAIMRETEATASRFNAAIRARTKQLEVADAVRLYRELRQEGGALETATVNLMMQVCIAIKEAAYGLKLFDAMEPLGVRADERTYALAIRAASLMSKAEGGGWIKSLRLLNAMRAKKPTPGTPKLKGRPVVPSAMCFRDTIKALAASGEAVKAASVVDQMIDAGHTPDAPTFAMATRACALRGRLDDALGLQDTMRRLGVKRDLANIAAVLLACERRSDGRRAVKVLRSMSNDQLQATTLTYNMVLAANAKAGRLPVVLALLREMSEAGDVARPDVVTMNTVLDAYKRAHRWEDLLNVLLSMEVRCPQPRSLR